MNGVGDLGDYGDEGGSGLGRAAVEEAVDVGEEDEEVGVDVGHEEGGELVVVAEDAFVGGKVGGSVELEGGDGVVFVDDGDDAEREEGVEGAAEVGVACGIAEVVLGEEDLGDAAAELVEGVVVDAHEAGLADGGAGLNLGEVGGACRKAQALDTEADGAGGDDEDLVAKLAEGGDGLDEAAEEAEGDTAVRAHDDVGAELDDDAAPGGRWGCRCGRLSCVRIELLGVQLLGRQTAPSRLVRSMSFHASKRAIGMLKRYE